MSSFIVQHREKYFFNLKTRSILVVEQSSHSWVISAPFQMWMLPVKMVTSSSEDAPSAEWQWVLCPSGRKHNSASVVCAKIILSQRRTFKRMTMSVFSRGAAIWFRWYCTCKIDRDPKALLHGKREHLQILLNMTLRKLGGNWKVRQDKRRSCFVVEGFSLIWSQALCLWELTGRIVLKPCRAFL